MIRFILSRIGGMNGRRVLSPAEATRSALRVKGRPIVATTIILVGMMMVFWVSVFPPVVHFGLLLAVGLAGALLSALVLLPVWLGRGEHK